MQQSELEKKIKGEIYFRYNNAAVYEGKAMSKDRAIRDVNIIFDRIKPIYGISNLSKSLIEQVLGGFERGFFGELKLCPKSVIQCFQKRKAAEISAEQRQIKEDPGSVFNPRNSLCSEVLISLKTRIPERLEGRTRPRIGRHVKCFDGTIKFIYTFDVLPSDDTHTKRSYFLDCVNVYEKRRSIDDLIDYLETLSDIEHSEPTNNLRMKNAELY